MTTDKEMLEWANTPYPIIHSQCYIDMLNYERCDLVKAVKKAKAKLKKFDKKHEDVL